LSFGPCERTTRLPMAGYASIPSTCRCRASQLACPPSRAAIQPDWST
jgi:hypothetical protein